MIVDYAPFLHPAEDGSIWWRLEDAIKLGAGYLPVRDDDRNPVPILRAPNNRVRTDERTLIGAFRDVRLVMVRPKVLERDDGRFVEARDFLGWLSQYVAQTQAEIPFPHDLARAVKDATGAPVEHSTSPPAFESLTAALEEWFDRPLADLPDAQRRRVERDFFPMPWDMLTPDQRRSVAQQWDYQHDPATEEQRRLWWEFFVRKGGIEKEIEEWEAVSAPTATDLEKKETRLAELRREFEVMELANATELESLTWEGFDPESDTYPTELDFAMQAWRAVTNRPDPSKTPKEQVQDWLEHHYPKLSGEAKHRIAVVCNWEKSGGRPRRDEK